ncbi:MAG: FAD-dependent thymidylate synthase [Erysipelotrichales bacterium]|nr:FAD-dependent thymidylate synthase [Erysipelotrichales bacterium]
MDKLTIDVVGITTTDKEIIKNTTLKQLELNGGHSANICYTQKDYEEIIKEPEEKTLQRAEDNKGNKHHSVFGHDTVQLYIKGIPKLLVMMLNNEKEYNTSEKSGRYTIMYGADEENELYNEWKEIFERVIKETYPNEEYLTDDMISKKAKENARYLLSVFMKTKLKYSTSFRQLNYIYDFTEKMINEPTTNPLKIALRPYLEEFRDVLYSTGFITKGIKDYRNRHFSLIEDDNTFDDHFSRSYSVNYDASIPALADLLRHRTLDYSFSLKEKMEYFVPPIIRDKPDLVDKWLNDISSLSDFPQGMIVNVNETGKYEDFILKMYERMCTAPQLEVMQITKETLAKYIKAVSESPSENDRKIYEQLLRYNNGARCTFPGFVCPKPCKFKEGVELRRKI